MPLQAAYIHIPHELQELLLTCMDERLARSSGGSSAGVTVCLLVL